MAVRQRWAAETPLFPPLSGGDGGPGGKPGASGCRRSRVRDAVAARDRRGSVRGRRARGEVQPHPRMPHPRTAASASTKIPLFTGPTDEYGRAAHPARLLPRDAGSQNPSSHHSFAGHPPPHPPPAEAAPAATPARAPGLLRGGFGAESWWGFDTRSHGTSRGGTQGSSLA